MTQTPDTKLPLTSETPLEARLAALKDIIPEAFTEDKIDFDKLKSALGSVAETGQERYGLTWAGKSEAIRAVQIPSKGTLEPMPEASIDFDKSQNLIIEGDNLEVLKLLQKSYYGKVKMIYIDPPYNTGKEFIYPDNFREGLEDYLLYSGQRQDDGTRLSTSEEAAGRKHSKWLTMMYPRLFLARNPLRDDGVIFVSIDDNEVKNLRALMDEVFGEENFLASVVWQKSYSPSNDKKGIDALHDYVLCYSKTSAATVNLFVRTEKQDKAYLNLDDDPRGSWKAENATRAEHRDYAFYPITTPSGNIVYPASGRSWIFNQEEVPDLIADNRLWFGKDGSAKPSIKRFLSEVKQGVVPTTWWTHQDAGHNDAAMKELKQLFPEGVAFDTPKPTRLVSRMLQLTTSSSHGDIVLDFFAGSGTTGHAVAELNEAHNGNRRFILVQLPEKTDRPDYSTIADVTRERVRRAISKLNKADEGKLELTDRPDRGFKAFRLTDSNFKVWDADNAPQDAAALEAQLDLYTENVTGEKEPSVLYELVLKSGFPLTAKIERLELSQPVYAVEGKALYICLADPVTQETLAAVADAKPERFVCLDVAFDGKDELKTNTVLQMRNAGIAFYTA